MGHTAVHGSAANHTRTRRVPAGIYYPAGSLKPALCVDGRERLYHFCARFDVPHERCGKLIVATHAGEIAALQGLAACAAGNGVRVELVDRAFAQAREPHVAAVAALWSPDTGRIEPEAYVRALR